MRLSLQTRITLLITVVAVATSATGSFLFISAHKRSMEREIINRGITMSEALSRAVSEGLASENLQLIQQVQSIVHTRDVKLAQVYSTIWLPVDAYPLEKFEEPPDRAAIEHFSRGEAFFYKNNINQVDLYSPVFYHRFEQTRGRQYLIGYVRLMLTTEGVRQTVNRMLMINIIASVLLTVIAIVILDVLVGKYLLVPLMNLRESISKYRDGSLSGVIPVDSDDEIGELSREFNRMITERSQAQAVLAEEKERLGVTLRCIGDGVVVTDTNGAVTLMNRVAEELTGWRGEEGQGKPLSTVFNIINEETRLPCENPVERVLSKGLIVGLANHTALIRRDGTEIIIADSAAPIRDSASRVIGVVLVFRDITIQQKVEAELQKMEKLESLGLLAGGLAHDFNNLLTAIIGNISFVKMHIEPGTKDYERLAAAESATDRATNLTQQLLTFAKGGAPIKNAISIADIVRESVGFALSGSNVRCDYSLPEGLWAIEADNGQMVQVFNNLAINAMHSMPHGGTINVSFRNATLPENSVPNLKQGEYVEIIFRDHGTGISRDHIPKIFDPYFTTKKQGSGLGLASVFSILNKHDGYITVESEVALGTTFHIYLPAAAGRGTVPGKHKHIYPGGGGKALVMDDEAIVREIAGEMLKELGFEVWSAVSGDNAVSLYKQALAEGKPYDVVIMDLTVPGGMGGRDAAMNILEIDPGARLIVSSGYSTDPIMSDYKKYGFRGVLAKPYRIEQISDEIQRVCKGP